MADSFIFRPFYKAAIPRADSAVRRPGVRPHRDFRNTFHNNEIPLPYNTARLLSHARKRRRPGPEEPYRATTGIPHPHRKKRRAASAGTCRQTCICQNPQMRFSGGRRIIEIVENDFGNVYFIEILLTCTQKRLQYDLY